MCVLYFPVMPAFGVAQETFVASYTIHNTTTLVQEFEVKITSSEYFMLAGPQQVMGSVTCPLVDVMCSVDKISCAPSSFTCTDIQHVSSVIW